MRIFLSFAQEQSKLAESTYLKLRSAGYTVFFATTDIRSSDGYDKRIRNEIARSDKLLFLASSEALTSGKYTLNELEMFSAKWPDPTNRVLTVILGELNYDDLPPYLGSVTSALTPAGEPATGIASRVVASWPLKRWRVVLSPLISATALSIILLFAGVLARKISWIDAIVYMPALVTLFAGIVLFVRRKR